MQKKITKKQGYDSKKLGNILLEAGNITEEQLARSIEKHKKSRKRLGETLVEMGFVTEAEIARTLSIQLGIPYIDLESAVVEPMAIELVPEKLAKAFEVLPLSIERGVLTIVMADPLNFEAIQDLGFAADRNVVPTVAPASEITKAINRYYHISEPAHQVLEKMSAGFIEVLPERAEAAENLDQVIKRGESPPIVRMVNTILYNAIKNRASDIHLEPRSKSVVIRERVDGLLRDVFELPKWVQGAVTSRIKVLSRLDIAVKRVPQDGRIKINIEDREVDLRVSVLPIQYGESIVIRILDSRATVLRLPDLGLIGKDLTRVRGAIERPQGIVLVTGPTGSGKTYTLYAMIAHIRSDTINVVSLEEPIEYEMHGVKQVAVNVKTGLTFAYGLRSVLRQDPDVIMVGEMRDAETISSAIQASLTGHLVLSTLHTNTAAAAVTRLRNMGVAPYLIASSLNGVIAQRLVRRLCGRCKEAYEPAEEDLLKLGLKREGKPNFKLYRGTGCAHCNGTGYRGRVGTFEVLVCDPPIKELITEGAPEEAIQKAALAGGMRQISDDGVEKVLEGITSVDELQRVLHVEEGDVVHVCGNCGENLRAEFISCPYCGHPTSARCPECGKPREADWRYCPYCRR
jgi:type IV pilus assembly protein PilB